MKKVRLALLLFFFLLPSLCQGPGMGLFSQSPIDSLTTLLKTDKEDTNKVKHLNALGWELMYQNPDSAILIGNQALDLATSINDPVLHSQGWLKGIAKSNSNLGAYYFLKGEYTKALENHFKSLKLNEQIGNKMGVAGNLNNIGLVYYYQGDYSKALEYFFKAQQLNEKIGNKKGIAESTVNIGNGYWAQGNYSQSLEYYFKALKLDEEIGDKNGVASDLGNIGGVYQELGDNTKALEFHFKALKLYEEIGNKNSIAINLINIGDIYVLQKKYKVAEEFLTKALEVCTEIGALDYIKETHQILSELYSQTNRYQLAYEHYKLYTAAKDSLFNEEKSKEIGRLEVRHEIEMAEMERERKAQEEIKIKTQKTERRNLLEYSGMVIGLIIIGLFVTLLGFVKLKPWVAEGITFFVFLLFFEFLLVLLDPYMDKFTKGEPAYKLLINAGVALCIFPLHAFFEKMLKKRLMKKK